jgi:hypothetical protein
MSVQERWWWTMVYADRGSVNPNSGVKIDNVVVRGTYHALEPLRILKLVTISSGSV